MDKYPKKITTKQFEIRQKIRYLIFPKKTRAYLYFKIQKNFKLSKLLTYTFNLKQLSLKLFNASGKQYKNMCWHVSNSHCCVRPEMPTNKSVALEFCVGNKGGEKLPFRNLKLLPSKTNLDQRSWSASNYKHKKKD